MTDTFALNIAFTSTSYYINFITQRNDGDSNYMHAVLARNLTSVKVCDYNITSGSYYNWFAMGY